MFDHDGTDGPERGPDEADPQDVVIQLLRMLSEVDLESLGEDLQQLDRATTQRAMTGASLLAEAITRATLGSDALGDVLGVELDEPSGHVSGDRRGERIEVHDDEVVDLGDRGRGA